MLQALHHVALSTTNLDRALAFYTDVLEGENISGEVSWPKGSDLADELAELDDTAARYAIVRIGNTFVELYEFSSPQSATETSVRRACDAGVYHFAFQVDDCRKTYEKLSAAGMRFHRGPTEIGDGTIFTFGRDPDNNIIEIVEIPPDATYGSGPNTN